MKTKFTALSEPVKILQRLQRFGYRTAIIAGGAIRDDFTGKEINDYDIFLWDPRHSMEFDGLYSKATMKLVIDVESDIFYMERTQDFMTLLETVDVNAILTHESGYGPTLRITNGDGDILDTPGIGAKLTGIWEAQLDYNDYQLILTQDNPIDHVEKYFDIGLCKAYCDGTKIRYTPDFLKDLTNRTFTIVGQEMTQEQFAYAIDYHADKIEWKYPNFRIEVAPHNLELYKEYKNS